MDKLHKITKSYDAAVETFSSISDSSKRREEKRDLLDVIEVNRNILESV
jgi:hypothetical protein